MSEESNKAFTDTQKFIIETSSRQARMEESLKSIQKDLSMMAKTMHELGDTKKIVDDLNHRFSSYTARQQRMEQTLETNHDRIDHLEKEIAVAYGSLRTIKWLASGVGSILIMVSGYLFSEIVRLHDAELHMQRDISLITQTHTAHVEICGDQIKRLERDLSRLEK